MPLLRISITIPRDLVTEADRRARALDRSRSWVIVEALRAHLAPSRSRVREPAATRYEGTSPGLGPLRLAQLASDLQLTPEQRVRAAEENVRLSEQVRGSRGWRHGVLSFDRYEDYIDWQRTEPAAR